MQFEHTNLFALSSVFHFFPNSANDGKPIAYICILRSSSWSRFDLSENASRFGGDNTVFANKLCRSEARRTRSRLYL